MKGEKGEGEGQTGRNPARGRGKGQKQGGRTGVHRGARRSAPLLFKTTFKTKRVQITCFYGSLSRNPRKLGFGGAGRVWKRSKLPVQRVWMALQGLRSLGRPCQAVCVAWQANGRASRGARA